MTENIHKKNAYLTYNIISDWYEENRSYDLFEKPILDKIISVIPPAGQVLDLGCGTGNPIMQYFIGKRYKVVGVDASEKLLEKARANFPDEELILADMRTIDLDRKFDCIIAWHSFFHLPKENQREMFEIFEKHIKPKGVLVFTSGPDEGEVWSDNGGEDLYHASLSPIEYNQLLTSHHFKVLLYQSEEADLRGATVWIAQAN